MLEGGVRACGEAVVYEANVVVLQLDVVIVWKEQRKLRKYNTLWSIFESGCLPNIQVRHALNQLWFICGHRAVESSIHLFRMCVSFF
jgi:hypothetical protein